jgi:Domain of unknown function (DUF4407)
VSVGTRDQGLMSLGDKLAWLGGADAEVLRDVPGSSRNRFVQMALVLLTTASLAAVSMTFALHDGVHVSWVAAAPFGLFWALVILNIDRFLIMSMGTTHDRRQLLMMAVPRVVMAMVLAAVISTPLVLRVFRSDIRSELFMHQLSESRQQAAAERQTSAQQEANRLTALIRQDQSIVAGNLRGSVNLPTLQDATTQVTQLQSEVKSQQATTNAALEAWQCELYGAGSHCRGASNRAGAGPLAMAKHSEYLQDAANLNRAKGQLTVAMSARDKAMKQEERAQSTALSTAQTQAKLALPGLRTRLAKLDRLIAQEADQGNALDAADSGLLAQIQALSRISSRESALFIAHWLVGLLFFLIEILPVLVKVLLGFAPPTAYDIAAQLRDDEARDRLTLRRSEARQIEEDKSRARVKVESHMRDLEQRMGKKANAKVADEMSTILEEALKEWSETLRAQLAHGSTAVTSSPAPAPGAAVPRPPAAGQSHPSATAPLAVEVDDDADHNWTSAPFAGRRAKRGPSPVFVHSNGHPDDGRTSLSMGPTSDPTGTMSDADPAPATPTGGVIYNVEDDSYVPPDDDL